jgi:hypothetical protein
MQVVPRQYSSFLSGLLVLIAAVLVGLYVWTMSKGVDITDEGFYMLSYSYPAEYAVSSTSFHLLVSKLLPASQVSVVGYRLASLISGVLTAGVFSWGFRRWLLARQGGAPSLVLLVALFVIGNMLQYAISARALNYNGLNSLAIAVFAASLLNYAATPGRKALLGLLVGGLAMGLDIFVKFSSSGIVFGTGALVLLLSILPLKKLTDLRPLVVLGVGLLLGVAVFALFVQPLPAWYSGWRHETTILMKGMYGSGLVVRYVQDAYPVVRTLIYPFGVVALLASGWVYAQGRYLTKNWQHVAVVAVVVLLLLVEAVRTALYKNTHLNYNRSSVWLLGPLLVVVAMLLAARLRYRHLSSHQGRWYTYVLPLWLLALPLLAAFGTVNQLFNNALLDAMYWLAVLVWLVQLLPADMRYLRSAQIVLLALPALAVAEQATYGMLWAPYLQLENMFSQDTPLTVGAPMEPARLLVDAPSAAYIKGIRTALYGAGFRAGEPILALYDAPGLVYALGGISPGNPWYPGFQNQEIRNCDALAKTHLDLHRAFILLNQTPTASIKACLAEHGLHFPADYVLVHQAMSPFSRSQYNWHSYEDTMQVYAPRYPRRAPAAAH